MPDLTKDLHLGMLEGGKKRFPDQKLYGLHWGDPDEQPHLDFFREKYIHPYLDPR
jgi:hypothetical protein